MPRNIPQPAERFRESREAPRPAEEPLPEIDPNHPLAEVIGKFEGEAWEAMLEAIRRNREEMRRWQE